MYIYLYLSFIINSLRCHVCFNLWPAKNFICILNPAFKLVPKAYKPLS